MAIDLIPSRLLCVTIGPEDRIQVPFPIGSVAAPMPNSEDDRKFFRENQFLIVTHPDSIVGVLGAIAAVYDDGYNLVVELTGLYRVILKNTSVDKENRQFAEWGSLDDIPPTSAEFASKRFQERIRELQRAEMKFIFLAKEKELPGDLKLSTLPRGISEKTIGLWIDQAVDIMNVFADREEIRKFLIAALAEPDVKKRLEIAIDLYTYCAKNVDDFGAEFREEVDQNLRQILFPEVEGTKKADSLHKTAKSETGTQNRQGPAKIQEVENGRELVRKELMRPRESFKRFNEEKRVYRPGKILVELDYKSPTPFMKLVLDFFDQYIVGQRRGKLHMVRLLVRLRNGLIGENLPVIGGIFPGPTGVGKTELVMTLARFLFDDPEGLTLIPCGNLKERHEAAFLKGSPPGYIGYDDEPALSQWNLDKHHFLKIVRDKYGPAVAERARDVSEEVGRFRNIVKNIPRAAMDPANRKKLESLEKELVSFGYRPGKFLSIVLWDEIEKAHSSVLDAQLDILNKGKFKLMSGEVTNLQNSIQFWTSNIYGQEILAKLSNGGGVGFRVPEESSQTEKDIWIPTRDAIVKYFSTKPEFLGRIGKENIVVFGPLSREDRFLLLDKMYFNEFAEGLNRKQGIEVYLTDDAKELIVEEAYDPLNRALGARAVRHVFERLVENGLANILDRGGEGGAVKGDKVLVDVRGGELLIKREKRENEGRT